MIHCDPDKQHPLKLSTLEFTRIMVTYRKEKTTRVIRAAMQESTSIA